MFIGANNLNLGLLKIWLHKECKGDTHVNPVIENQVQEAAKKAGDIDFNSAFNQVSKLQPDEQALEKFLQALKSQSN